MNSYDQVIKQKEMAVGVLNKVITTCGQERLKKYSERTSQKKKKKAEWKKKPNMDIMETFTLQYMEIFHMYYLMAQRKCATAGLCSV